METMYALGPASNVETLNPSPFPPDLTQALESFEAEVWRNVYRAASEEDIATCGLRMGEAGSATWMAASNIDVLFFNRVVGLGMAAPATEAMLETLIGAYGEAGVRRFFVQVSPAAMPAELFDWLPRHGFRHYNNWVKFFRGIEPPPRAETDLRIEPISAEHAETFAQFITPAFDWPVVTQPWMACLVGRPGWQHYFAFEGNVPAATGAMFAQGNYAYMGPAVTLPAYRGRGAQSALLARRIRDAAALGCRWLILETAQPTPDRDVPSFRNVQRFGFEVAYVRPNYLFEFDKG